MSDTTAIEWTATRLPFRADVLLKLANGDET